MQGFFLYMQLLGLFDHSWNGFYGRVCGWTVYITLFGFAIAFVITSIISIREIFYHQKERHQTACTVRDLFFLLFFGTVQVILSNIPNFQDIKWLSKIVQITSVVYSCLGIGLAVAQATGNGMVKGTIGGISTSTVIEKIWRVAQALGDIALSFPFSILLLEIQGTFRLPPPQIRKKATVSLIITTILYMFCACLGYAAFGNDAPGDLLTGFKFSKYYWVVDIANVCIVVELVYVYQVHSRPLFAAVEEKLGVMFTHNTFLNRPYILLMRPDCEVNLLKLSFQTTFVVITVIIAAFIPYFNTILGLLGGIGFWPIAIFFPVKVYLQINQVEAWTIKWMMLRILTIVCFFIGGFSLIGSIVGIYQHAKNI